MLVSFTVANFRSFGDEVTLNMVASNKLNDHKNHLVPIGDTGEYALRAAVIYGANAAGKSNLVKAMDIAQRLIKESNTRRMSAAVPFRFKPPGDTSPTMFEFRFLIGGRVFIYGFDIKGDQYSAEWLAVKKGDDDIPLYSRNEQGKIEVPNAGRTHVDPTTFNALNVLQQLGVRNDQLFLNRAIAIPEAAQGSVLQSVLKWLTDDLIVLPVGSRSAELLDRLHTDDLFRSFCSAFLRNVGTGVGGLHFSVTEREVNDWERRFLPDLSKATMRTFLREADTDIVPKPDTPGMVIVRKLQSEHHIEPNKYTLPWSEESDGTQALLHLLPILAAPRNESRVVVIDELDRSLHPLICWEFVRFFSESCEGSPKQLIVTTHEAHLLNQELLRRDEYWFAEKDEKQQTQLTSLVDFNIRNDLKVEKGYLAGRFGAIPMIGGMQNLERLLDCAGKEEPDASQEAPA